MKKKRFTADTGRYDIINFLPQLRVYFDWDTLYIEVEFLRYYAYAGMRILNKKTNTL